jgi:hypothetical protein
MQALIAASAPAAVMAGLISIWAKAPPESIKLQLRAPITDVSFFIESSNPL